MNVSFLQELLTSVAEQGRQLLPRSLRGPGREDDITELAERAQLQPRRGVGRRHRQRAVAPLPGSRPGGPARLPQVPRPHHAARPGRGDPRRQGLSAGPETASLRALQRAVESPRIEFFRRLNLAPGATAEIVKLRRDLLATGRPLARPPRQRPAPSAGVLVQPRLPGAAPHRLAHAGHHPRQDHRLRGGARDPGLGRPAPPARPRRPQLLRLLPPLADRRAPDLRRGGADGRHPGRHRRGAGRGAQERRGIAHAHDGGVLLHLQLPGGPARHLVRQLPDQAGGGGPGEGAAEPAGRS